MRFYYYLLSFLHFKKESKYYFSIIVRYCVSWIMKDPEEKIALSAAFDRSSIDRLRMSRSFGIFRQRSPGKRKKKKSRRWKARGIDIDDDDGHAL